MITLIQTNDDTRFDISFDNGPVEGYVKIITQEGENIYAGFDLTHRKITDGFRNPIAAGVGVIPQYGERELAVIDRSITHLENELRGANGLRAQAYPRLLERARAYRARVEAGQYVE